jgi:hypothetical protein
MALSRRKMLKKAAAAGGAVLAPQVVTGQAPAQLTRHAGRPPIQGVRPAGYGRVVGGAQATAHPAA